MSGMAAGLGAEAPAEAIEIGQFAAGIEALGLDGLSEFGLASTIMGQRQQPDHGAARPRFSPSPASIASKAR